MKPSILAVMNAIFGDCVEKPKKDILPSCTDVKDMCRVVVIANPAEADFVSEKSRKLTTRIAVPLPKTNTSHYKVLYQWLPDFQHLVIFY